MEQPVNIVDLMVRLGILVKESENPDLYINDKNMMAFDHRYKADAHPNDKNSKAVKGRSRGKLQGIKPEWVGYKLMKPEV